jgi:hypothetical protein
MKLAKRLIGVLGFKRHSRGRKMEPTGSPEAYQEACQEVFPLVELTEEWRSKTCRLENYVLNQDNLSIYTVESEE